jgi:modulator of FtsH protease
VTAYEVSEWSDLFVATAGATAALSGLIFVAVSINLDRILAFRGVADFAMVALLMLVGVMLASIVGLIPGQSTAAYGWELLGGGLVWGGVTALRMSRSVDWQGDRHLASRIVTPALAILPLVVGAVSLIAGSGGGLYWIAAGMVASVFVAVINAWIVLVEILR